ncbi:MAG TPA: response regulator [Edaphobacter sp.]|nr:response regulator [Edaphobacter sp.]
MTKTLHTEVVPVEEAKREDSGPSKLDVLIVDDEQTIADTLAVILSRSGFSVRTAYDGKAAFEIAKQDPPTLVISDVVMPEMTGVELAIALKNKIPECRILLFSGQAATADLLDRARAEGHDFAIVSKPIHPKDLIRRVSEYLQPA